MKVKVVLFARPREVVGTGRLAIDLVEGATAGDAFDLLAARFPELARMKHVIRPAVDNDYASWSSELSDGCELALIPPTAGG